MGRGRDSDWYWRTIATARPSTGHAWLRDPEATAAQVAGAAGRAAKMSADWHERQRASGIVDGRSYGRWDEHGSWVRGDPGKRRPFSGTDDAAVVAVSELPAAERLARTEPRPPSKRTSDVRWPAVGSILLRRPTSNASALGGRRPIIGQN